VYFENSQSLDERPHHCLVTPTLTPYSLAHVTQFSNGISIGSFLCSNMLAITAIWPIIMGWC